jgi:hypothetical protein
MHKKTIIILAIVTLTLITIVPVLAVKPAGPSSTNGLEKGKNDHLYLYEKDPETWEIIEDSAWAKMNINTKKGKFVCNAHGLTPDTEYALICYQDPWPGEGSLLLGTAFADDEGNVHIKGEIDYDTLPSYQYTIGEGEDTYEVIGSKIWLVLADDYDSDQMAAWTPTDYLFEFDLINQQPPE